MTPLHPWKTFRSAVQTVARVVVDDRIALGFFLSGQGAFWAMANARYCTWIDAPDPRGRPREKLQEKPPDFRGQTPMVYGICSPEGSRTLGGMISAGLRYGFIPGQSPVGRSFNQMLYETYQWIWPQPLLVRLIRVTNRGLYSWRHSAEIKTM